MHKKGNTKRNKLCTHASSLNSLLHVAFNVSSSEECTALKCQKQNQQFTCYGYLIRALYLNSSNKITLSICSALMAPTVKSMCLKGLKELYLRVLQTHILHVFKGPTDMHACKLC